MATRGHDRVHQRSHGPQRRHSSLLFPNGPRAAVETAGQMEQTGLQLVLLSRTRQWRCPAFDPKERQTVLVLEGTVVRNIEYGVGFL